VLHTGAPFLFYDPGLYYTDNGLFMNSSRRDFIKRLSVAGAGLYALAGSVSNARAFSVPDTASKISVFSKNLQWLDYEPMAATAREIGFEGVDLTIRPNGHVLPERVAEDLPRAVAAVRNAGLDVYEVTTAITDAEDRYTEDILSALRDLGIKVYRLNWFEYDAAASMDDNISRMKLRMEKLAKLNEKYKLHGAYQNHAGSSFGASVWDMYEVLKDLNPEYIGCQFDVRHATVEGGNSWTNDFKRIYPYIKSYNIKDFAWVKKEAKWEAQSVPLGEGAVDYKKFFELIKQYNISGPVSMHFEYPLGGADQGAKTISIPKEKVIKAMKQDLATLKSWLQ
jgi:sugar phosphate isomerase/epimerase